MTGDCRHNEINEWSIDSREDGAWIVVHCKICGEMWQFKPMLDYNNKRVTATLEQITQTEAKR